MAPFCNEINPGDEQFVFKWRPQDDWAVLYTLPSQFSFCDNMTDSHRSARRRRQHASDLKKLSPQRVRFPFNPVSEVRERPYTSREEVPRMYYQAEDYRKFRSEARRNIEDEILEADECEINFSLSASIVSIVLAMVFLFACALAKIEKAYVRATVVSLSSTWHTTSSQQSCITASHGKRLSNGKFGL